MWDHYANTEGQVKRKAKDYAYCLKSSKDRKKDRKNREDCQNSCVKELLMMRPEYL
jgi:hypothetical protein